jgi:hypothetical protein
MTNDAARVQALRAVVSTVGARAERLIESGAAPFPLRVELISISRACSMAIEDDDKASREARVG